MMRENGIGERRSLARDWFVTKYRERITAPRDLMIRIRATTAWVLGLIATSSR
jgi:hypothetical protein